MWNTTKFISNFPEPQKRTKSDWQIIDKYMRLWRKHFDETIKRRAEDDFIRHCEDNAFFNSWE